NADYMPPLKYQDGSGSYPYEMFRYAPQNVAPPAFTADGGPYNLGVIWATGIIKDGKPFYCPSAVTVPSMKSHTYDYYAARAPWPCGIDLSQSPDHGDHVRSAFTYYPQSTVLQSFPVQTGNQDIPTWPENYTSPQPYKKWLCVPPFKQSAIDPIKSVTTDM